MRQSKFLVVFIAFSLSGCITSRIEDARENVTGLNDGQSVVIMAKSYHQGNETEGDYLTCIEKALGAGSKGISVVPHQKFIDNLFPWFEPRTAPADTKGLPALMDRPGVKDAVRDMGVRYVVWLDGDTERVAEGGSLSCAVGPGGGGCFGFAWWQNDVSDSPGGKTTRITKLQSGIWTTTSRLAPFPPMSAARPSCRLW